MKNSFSEDAIVEQPVMDMLSQELAWEHFSLNSPKIKALSVKA